MAQDDDISSDTDINDADIWKWLIQRERNRSSGRNSNDNIISEEILPLYIQIDERCPNPVNSEKPSKDEKGSQSPEIIDYIIFELGSKTAPSLV